MKIGFDVDGVLAEFCRAYEQRFIDLTGRNTFAPFEPEVGPKSWDWPVDLYGYTKAEESAVWEGIRNDPMFCVSLPPHADMTLLMQWYTANTWKAHNKHDVYFITSRVGPFAKAATEFWLKLFNIPTPTVLIVSGRDKGIVAKALKLDLFVEDNLDNANTIAAAGVKSYLIDRAYNRTTNPGTVIRVDSLQDILPTIS